MLVLALILGATTTVVLLNKKDNEASGEPSTPVGSGEPDISYVPTPQVVLRVSDVARYIEGEVRAQPLTAADKPGEVDGICEWRSSAFEKGPQTVLNVKATRFSAESGKPGVKAAAASLKSQREFNAGQGRPTGAVDVAGADDGAALQWLPSSGGASTMIVLARYRNLLVKVFYTRPGYTADQLRAVALEVATAMIADIKSH
ncbi:hypothetical protein [Amycolatopsis sp. NPDC059657]|uniref:hypothetical protein n=1 Tax=Amycolatopsis sp. NPDC059657 TaxID=3346899 RepID=UPI00366E9442